MKNKVIISSILTIAMCFSLIAGSTFALFTSNSQANIAVTSGNLEVVANINDDLALTSLGVAQTGTFANGGTAEIVTKDGIPTLELLRLTPGDSVSFSITVTNKSNVAMKYQFTWSVDGELVQYLTATVNGEALVNNSTDWALWEGAPTQNFTVVVTLPETVGNEAQNKTASITFKVDAVQANAPDSYFSENGIYESGNFSYRIVDGAAEIVKYNGNEDYIDIPSTINGYPVKTIKSGAFTTQSSVARFARNRNDDADRSIYIPDGIENIEEGSFKEEGNIYITGNTSIPDGWKDKSLKGKASDSNSDGNVYCEVDNRDCVMLDGILYFYDKNLACYAVADCFSTAKEITIPTAINDIPVGFIGNSAFKGSKTLEKITITENVTYIWHRAFQYCTELKEVNFNAPNISKILAFAFEGCTSLDKIYLPENLIYTQSYAFSYCGEINEVHIPASMTQFAKNTFANSSIKKVYYGSDQESFNRIIMTDDVREVLTNARIKYSDKEVISGITSITDAKDLEAGIEVTVRGYVATYYDYGYGFLLINEDNTDGILIYFQKTDVIDYKPVAGDYVEINGTTAMFSGQKELSHINSVVKLGHEELKPIKVTADDINNNYLDYEYRFIEFESTVIARDGYYTYFEGINMPFFIRKAGNPLIEGDYVIFKGTVLPFGASYELQSIYDSITIIRTEE